MERNSQIIIDDGFFLFYRIRNTFRAYTKYKHYSAIDTIFCSTPTKRPFTERPFTKGLFYKTSFLQNVQFTKRHFT